MSISADRKAGLYPHPPQPERPFGAFLVKLQLYVSGTGTSSQRAQQQARSVCEILDGCELEIIDIREEPGVADRDHVLTTPTLRRVDPLPERRVLGDMADPKEVAAYMSSH